MKFRATITFSAALCALSVSAFGAEPPAKLWLCKATCLAAGQYTNEVKVRCSGGIYLTKECTDYVGVDAVWVKEIAPYYGTNRDTTYEALKQNCASKFEHPWGGGSYQTILTDSDAIPTSADQACRPSTEEQVKALPPFQEKDSVAYDDLRNGHPAGTTYEYVDALYRKKDPSLLKVDASWIEQKLNTPNFKLTGLLLRTETYSTGVSYKDGHGLFVNKIAPYYMDGGGQPTTYGSWVNIPGPTHTNSVVYGIGNYKASDLKCIQEQLKIVRDTIPHLKATQENGWKRGVEISYLRNEDTTFRVIDTRVRFSNGWLVVPVLAVPGESCRVSTREAIEKASVTEIDPSQGSVGGNFESSKGLIEDIDHELSTPNAAGAN